MHRYNSTGSKCTVSSIFYTESRVKIRSTERGMKNMEVVGTESDGPYWSSSAVLLILASNTEVYFPSSDTESQLGYNNTVLCDIT